MTTEWKVIDRAMPQRVSGGLVGSDGRGVCGSHQLKDDRCGGGEMVGWGVYTADRKGKKVYSGSRYRFGTCRSWKSWTGVEIERWGLGLVGRKGMGMS